MQTWIYECHILHILNASLLWLLASCQRIYINERLWHHLTSAIIFWSGPTSDLGPSFEKCFPRLGNAPGLVWQWHLILGWLGEAILLFNHKISEPPKAKTAQYIICSIIFIFYSLLLQFLWIQSLIKTILPKHRQTNKTVQIRYARTK